jgi:hypothetical protein
MKIASSSSQSRWLWSICGNSRSSWTGAFMPELFAR